MSSAMLLANREGTRIGGGRFFRERRSFNIYETEGISRSPRAMLGGTPSWIYRHGETAQKSYPARISKGKPSGRLNPHPRLSRDRQDRQGSRCREAIATPDPRISVRVLPRDAMRGAPCMSANATNKLTRSVAPSTSPWWEPLPSPRRGWAADGGMLLFALTPAPPHYHAVGKQLPRAYSVPFEVETYEVDAERRNISRNLFMLRSREPVGTRG